MERKAGASGRWRMGAVGACPSVPCGHVGLGRAGTWGLGGQVFGVRPWAFTADGARGADRKAPCVWGGLYLPEGVGLPVVAPRWV